MLKVHRLILIHFYGFIVLISFAFGLCCLFSWLSLDPFLIYFDLFDHWPTS